MATKLLSRFELFLGNAAHRNSLSSVTDGLKVFDVSVLQK